MIWLTWRQFRMQAATAAVALVAFAVLLAVTGPHLASLYAASGITGCHFGSCGQLADRFLSLLDAGGTYPVVYALGIAGIIVAPAIIGISWGAPLIARELETGTFRLAWTQDITRARWLTVKLTLVGLAAMAVTEGFSVMQAWWAAPISQAARIAPNTPAPLGFGPFSPLAFAAHGITPLGYAAFAFILGATAGIVLRRSVPAMGVTLAIFTAIQVAVPLWIRPNVFPPEHTTVAISSTNVTTQTNINDTFAVTVDFLPSQPGAWIISSGAVNAAGQPVSGIPAACGASGPSSPHLLPCLSRQGIRIDVSYQPVGRYWAFQWIETAIFIALASALTWYCFWYLVRRLS
jgi:hypothetical protein